MRQILIIIFIYFLHLLCVAVAVAVAAADDDDDNHANNIDRRSLYFETYPLRFQAKHSPSYDYIYLPGDILLGGFFPIHQPPSNEYDSMQCTAIKRERGIQRLEAMLFALDVVNQRSSDLMAKMLAHTNIRFGALIYDSCDYESYAVERTMNMLLPAIDQCPLKSNSPSMTVAGVIGSASSIVSMAIADILRLAEIPQLSYASTSTELSQKPRFQYFSRVVPPDTHQAEAVVSIIQFLNWTYVAVIKETGSYGERLTDDLKAKLKNKTICIAGELSVNIKDSNSYLRVIKELYEDEKYRFVVGVVVFAQEDSVRQMLNQTSSKQEFIGRWVFLGTDGWGKKWYPVENFGRAAINAITIAPKSYPVENFDDYFKNLIPSKNTRNPWFLEYWEETYKCKFDQTPTTIFNQNYTRLCSDNDHILTNISVPYSQEGYVHYVVDAVFTLVIAIQRLVEEKCPYSPRNEPICRQFYPFDGTRLLSILRKVSFRNDLSQRSIKFTDTGDGIGTYDIFQYQLSDVHETWNYVAIGEFGDGDRNHERIRIDLDQLKWFEYNRQQSIWYETEETPRSFCTESCRSGEIRTNTDSQQCCWTCRACPLFHIAVNETTCLPCSTKEIPNGNFTKCISIAEEYLSIHNVIAWPALVLSSIGLVMTLYTIVIFIRFSHTPIIKASSRELSYFLLSGICLCHLCAWPLILKPHIITCFFIRIGVSLSLTICLAALLTKTNRLARIFNNKQRLTQPSCLSPRSQLGICAGIVSVQLIAVLLWIIISPPAVRLKSEIKHNQRRLIIVCQTENEYIAGSLVYNMILVVSCTLYAIKTRRIPENFNETKHIGFAMYSVCIIWLAFVPIFFSVRTSDNWFRIQFVSLAICLSLSATVILVCLFAPKLYIVLFNPSKNTQSKFKATLAKKSSLIDNNKEHHHLDALIVKTMNNHQRRLSPPDFTTEVTFCHSKSNSWTMNTDEMIQTEQIPRHSSILNGTFSEPQNLSSRRSNLPRRIDPPHETLLNTSTSTKRRPSASATTTSATLPKSITSNLAMTNENPWKKLGNVRYKIDQEKLTNKKRLEQIYAQHITFV